MSLIYFCTCVYLHFSIYNRLIKPTLLEMCILFLLIFTLYLVATIMFYANYSIFWKNTHPILPVKSTHNTPPFVNRNYPEWYLILSLLLLSRGSFIFCLYNLIVREHAIFLLRTQLLSSSALQQVLQRTISLCRIWHCSRTLYQFALQSKSL